MPLQVTLHLSLTMDICCDWGNIYQQSPHLRVLSDKKRGLKQFIICFSHKRIVGVSDDSGTSECSSAWEVFDIVPGDWVPLRGRVCYSNEITCCHIVGCTLMSMDADPNMYPILIPPASNTFYFCHHPQPHAQSIIYHPSFIINGNFWYRAYSIPNFSIFPIFSRLPSLLRPPLNSVKWSSPQNDSCHRR